MLPSPKGYLPFVGRYCSTLSRVRHSREAAKTRRFIALPSSRCSARNLLKISNRTGRFFGRGYLRVFAAWRERGEAADELWRVELYAHEKRRGKRTILENFLIDDESAVFEAHTRN